MKTTGFASSMNVFLLIGRNAKRITKQRKEGREMTNQEAERLTHSHYEYLAHADRGVIELVWISEPEQDLKTLCEIDLSEFDRDEIDDYTELDDFGVSIDFAGYLSNTEIHIEELVEFSHTHGLLKFDLRRELENMGFGVDNSYAFLHMEKEYIGVSAYWYHVMVGLSGKGNKDIFPTPTTYDQFQPVRERIEELRKEAKA